MNTPIKTVAAFILISTASAASFGDVISDIRSSVKDNWRKLTKRSAEIGDLREERKSLPDRSWWFFTTDKRDQDAKIRERLMAVRELLLSTNARKILEDVDELDEDLAELDEESLSVRVEGLRPATRYWYRTITTPFTDYKSIYNAKLGEPIVSEAHSFTTLGAGAAAHFCVINDTHAKWEPFEMVVAKAKSLAPSAIVWNGDATNTTQDKRTAAEIFLDPPIATKDWSSDIPVCFESGNHDFRGSWISKKEEVMFARHPAERRGDQWDLKWNFAVRLGDLAMIGMDTGEDKPDGHPKWFGLANFEPYRKAQAKWLEEALMRPDIAQAKFKVLFCHIPLFAAKDHPDYPHDGVKIDPNDYAYWSRECHDLWAPILEKAGVQLVIAAHKHRFRYDAPTKDRKWAQIVGGGPALGVARGKADAGLFPTVIEGKVEGGKLVVTVHDVFNGRIAGTYAYD